MIYCPAFDLYHCIYRMLQILGRFTEGDSMETDRLRIYDFYLLFPHKIHAIRIPLTARVAREHRKLYVKKKENPFNIVPCESRLMERLKPYQVSALHHLASYGIIDASLLAEGKVRIANAETLRSVLKDLQQPLDQERNALSWLMLYTKTIPLGGVDGLKDRTMLLEYRYDAC